MFGSFIELRNGGQRSLTGAIINVETDLKRCEAVLPRTLAEAEVVHVRLRRRLKVDTFWMSEMVRPTVILNALDFLRKTALYKSEEIRFRQLHEFVYECENLEKIECSDGEDGVENTEDIVDDDDDDSCVPVIDSMVQTMFTSDMIRDMIYEIAPGEGNKLHSLLKDKYCEELAYPNIFGGEVQRKPKTMPYKELAKWKLRSSDRRAANDPQYLFFLLRKLQLIQVLIACEFRMRKNNMSNLNSCNAGFLKCQERRDKLVQDNMVYRHLSELRSHPHYMVKVKNEAFAMLRQLGIPTLWETKSAADTHWKELIRMLVLIAEHRIISDSEFDSMCHGDKCQYIRNDPVTCARYYDHRMRAFQNIMMKNCNEMYGHVSDYMFCDESQCRGSLHRHGLIWIKDAPIYGVDRDEDVCNWIDAHITTDGDCIPAK